MSDNILVKVDNNLYKTVRDPPLDLYPLLGPPLVF